MIFAIFPQITVLIYIYVYIYIIYIYIAVLTSKSRVRWVATFVEGVLALRWLYRCHGDVLGGAAGCHGWQGAMERLWPDPESLSLPTPLNRIQVIVLCRQQASSRS